MAKTDRRVQRTRALLQQALVELVNERGYEEITIQEIVDRANVGRTTFYLHYGSKDDLFMSCHEAVVSQFHFGPLFPHPLSREELLSPEVPPGIAAAYRHLKEAWMRLHPIFQGKDGSLILRRIRNSSAQQIRENLCATFGGAESTIALDVLANYLAGAQLSLVQWWLEQQWHKEDQQHTPEDLASAFHRLQSAALREALGL